MSVDQVERLVARVRWNTRGAPRIVDWNALRCLSVQDPWIKLLGVGEKTYELRGRVTHYRGPIVLCSSLRASRDVAAHRAAQRAREHYERAHGTRWAPDPIGQALYIAHLVDCFPALRIGSHAMHACCVPPSGMYVWEVEHVWALPKPFPVSGQLGLYPPSKGLRTYLRRVLT